MTAQAISALVDASLEANGDFAGLRERFLSRRIPPEKRALTVPAHIAKHVGREAGEYLVYFVTDDDPTNVFFDERQNLFGAAWGPEQQSGRYIDLGARSSNVLEMLGA